MMLKLKVRSGTVSVFIAVILFIVFSSLVRAKQIPRGDGESPWKIPILNAVRVCHYFTCIVIQNHFYFPCVHVVSRN